MPGRRCTKCYKLWPATTKYFPPHKKGCDGLHAWCRPCKRAYDRRHHRRYYRANREAWTEYMRRWYEKNRDTKAEYDRRYYRANRDAYAERMRRWYAENREERREYMRQYREAKPEVWHAARRRRRAHKLEAPGDGVTSEQWQEVLERYGHRCLACGATEDLTMDHVVPLAKGGAHDVSNIQPLCHSCNASKGTNVVDYRPDGGARIRTAG